MEETPSSDNKEETQKEEDTNSQSEESIYNTNSGQNSNPLFDS